PSTSRSSSPGRELKHKSSPDTTTSSEAASKSTGKPKKDNGRKKLFGRKHRASIESSLDHHPEEQQRVPLSLPPPSPLPTITDSSHRPWEEMNSMVKKLQETVTKLENEHKIIHASM
ncbi:hypothetical protein GBAR_LOCUS30567, partial [Geodia barretti]